MHSKIIERKRRGARTRVKIKELRIDRLTIHRTPRHIYAQIIAPTGDKVLASASTLDKEIRDTLKYTGNVEAAVAIGKKIAESALKVGVKHVAFDRAGFKYHGRIKALADAAREIGLQF